MKSTSGPTPNVAAEAGPMDAGQGDADMADMKDATPVIDNPLMTKLYERLSRARLGGRKTVQYKPPTSAEELAHATWVREAMAAAIAGKQPPTAAPAGFKLVDMHGIWVLRELRNQRRGAGALVLRVGAARPVLVEAPHTFFDKGTLPIAIAVFEAQQARALMINTAHRNLARWMASGAAKASGEPASTDKEAELDDDDGGVDEEEDEGGGDDESDANNPSPSDVAHAQSSFFLTAHRAMLGALPNAVTVQIHGFQDDKVPGAGAVLSAACSSGDVAGLAARLRHALGDHQVKIYPSEVQQLGGTQNVEAKASCGARAPFFHVELSRTVRDKLAADAQVRARFARALDPIFLPQAPPRP